MKVTGLIKKAGEVKKTSKCYDLKVDSVIPLSDTYVVSVNTECETTEKEKEKYTHFEYRNIISIIYGTISEGNLDFNIQMITYSNGGFLMNQIILAECLEYPNYIFDYDTDSFHSIHPSFILNMNDLQTLPDCSGKTVFDSIEYFVNELRSKCEYKNLYEFFILGKRRAMDFQEFNNYIDPPF